MFRIVGKVLGTERVKGEGQDGSTWDFVRVHVLSGLEVTKCRVGDDWAGPLPSEGEDIDCEVTIRPFSGRNGAALAVTLVRPHDGKTAARAA